MTDKVRKREMAILEALVTKGDMNQVEVQHETGFKPMSVSRTFASLVHDHLVSLNPTTWKYHAEIKMEEMFAGEVGDWILGNNVRSLLTSDERGSLILMRSDFPEEVLKLVQNNKKIVEAATKLRDLVYETAVRYYADHVDKETVQIARETLLPAWRTSKLQQDHRGVSVPELTKDTKRRYIVKVAGRTGVERHKALLSLFVPVVGFRNFRHASSVVPEKKSA